MLFAYRQLDGPQCVRCGCASETATLGTHPWAGGLSAYRLDGSNGGAEDHRGLQRCADRDTDRIHDHCIGRGRPAGMAYDATPGSPKKPF